MPRTEEQNKAIRDSRRKKLTEAALECFAQHGYSHTSVKMIAEKADVSKGLLYNYFDSKKALLHAVLQDAIDSGKEVMKVLEDERKSAGEILIKIVDSLFDLIQDDIKHWKFFTSLAMQSEIRDEMEDEIIEQNRQSLKQFETLFFRLGVEDSRMEAYFIGAFLDGILLGKVTLEEEYPYTEMHEKFKTFIKERYHL